MNEAIRDRLERFFEKWKIPRVVITDITAGHVVVRVNLDAWRATFERKLGVDIDEQCTPGTRDLIEVRKSMRAKSIAGHLKDELVPLKHDRRDIVHSTGLVDKDDAIVDIIVIIIEKSSRATRRDA